MEDVNLYDVASNCVNMLTLHAEENDVKFHLKGSGTHVKGSHSMIEELVYNLCDNAIRYNREGGNIWVVVDPEDHSILVSDDGIGISDEPVKYEPCCGSDCSCDYHINNHKNASDSYYILITNPAAYF